jgi:hypothetical protein
VHGWLLRYRQEGVAGLEDRSHGVRVHPWRISEDLEEAICELRGGIASGGRAGWCSRWTAVTMAW